MNPQVITRKLQAGKAEPEIKVVDTFLENGKLKYIPSARGKRLHVLKFLVAKLDPKKVYSEEKSISSSLLFTPKFAPSAANSS